MLVGQVAMIGALIVAFPKRRIDNTVLLVQHHGSADKPLANLEDIPVHREVEKQRIHLHQDTNSIVLIHPGQSIATILDINLLKSPIKRLGKRGHLLRSIAPSTTAYPSSFIDSQALSISVSD